VTRANTGGIGYQSRFTVIELASAEIIADHRKTHPMVLTLGVECSATPDL
jgi:hypothetical protein